MRDGCNSACPCCRELKTSQREIEHAGNTRINGTTDGSTQLVYNTHVVREEIADARAKGKHILRQHVCAAKGKRVETIGRGGLYRLGYIAAQVVALPAPRRLQCGLCVKEQLCFATTRNGIVIQCRAYSLMLRRSKAIPAAADLFPWNQRLTAQKLSEFTSPAPGAFLASDSQKL